MASFTSLLKLAIPFFADHLCQAVELIGGGDVLQGIVQADEVVVLDVLCDPAYGFLVADDGKRANSLRLEALMPAFELVPSSSQPRSWLAGNSARTVQYLT